MLGQPRQPGRPRFGSAWTAAGHAPPERLQESGPSACPWAVAKPPHDSQIPCMRYGRRTRLGAFCATFIAWAAIVAHHRPAVADLEHWHTCGRQNDRNIPAHDPSASKIRGRRTARARTRTRKVGNARWTLRWELVLNAFAAASGDRWPTAGTHGPKTRSTDRRANPRRNAGKR
jgi:hypothetical protein